MPSGKAEPFCEVIFWLVDATPSARMSGPGEGRWKLKMVSLRAVDYETEWYATKKNECRI